jgi:hypothetical protein
MRGSPPLFFIAAGARCATPDRIRILIPLQTREEVLLWM